MRRISWCPGWLVVAILSLLVGCQHSQPSRFPPDPLLVSKTPVESRGEPGLGPIAARHEPPAPERLVAAVLPTEAGDGSAVPTSLHSPGGDDH